MSYRIIEIEDDGSDYLIPNSISRWCGAGNVTVDDGYRMCGNCADRARQEE